MPTLRMPGVYVEEVSFRAKRIVEPARNLTAFIGPATRGPLDAVSPVFTSYLAFARVYGGVTDRIGETGSVVHHLAWAVKSFFAEGGQYLVVVRIAPPKRVKPVGTSYAKAFAVLARIADVEVVAAPGATDYDPTLSGRLLEEARRPGSGRFVLVDPPRNASDGELQQRVANDRADSAALYAPWVLVKDGTKPGRTVTVPPSGLVAGVYARVEAERGIFKSPANVVLHSAVGFEREIPTAAQDALNSAGVNVLRTLPRVGPVVWGARTTSSDPEWKYVFVRRTYLRIARSIERGLAWVVVEANGPGLWAVVRKQVENYLYDCWRTGALQGLKVEQAYFVRCDRTTMTDADLSAGRLVVLIGVAFVKPAEFSTFRVVLTGLASD